MQLSQAPGIAGLGLSLVNIGYNISKDTAKGVLRLARPATYRTATHPSRQTDPNSHSDTPHLHLEFTTRLYPSLRRDFNIEDLRLRYYINNGPDQLINGALRRHQRATMTWTHLNDDLRSPSTYLQGKGDLGDFQIS